MEGPGEILEAVYILAMSDAWRHPHKKAKLDAALEFFGKVLLHAKNVDERTKANLAMDEVYLPQNKHTSAKAKFEEALLDNPKLEATVDEAMCKRNNTPKPGY
jgi:hypothetical protein